MKKLTIILAILIFSGNLWWVSAVGNDDSAVPLPDSSAYILVENSTGQVLSEFNADEKLAPASLTKIMVLLLVAEEINAGRLSMTWYLSDDDLPDINDYDIINTPRTYMYFDKPVQYPFGFGLSYTSFEYRDISAFCDGEDFTITCKVSNIGERSGDEVVQLYATMHDMSIKAPLKQLCGFSRIDLMPGETEVVSFFVHGHEIRLFDENEKAFSLIPGSVTFSIGSSSSEIHLTEVLYI